jgi:hypothetical protein
MTKLSTCQNQGDEQQEADAHDHGEREESFSDDGEDDPVRLGGDLPDGVHRILKLGEDARGAKQQDDQPQDGVERQGVRPLRVLDHALDRLGGGLPERPAELLAQLSAGGFLPEHQRHQGQQQDHQRRQRNDRVESQGGAKTLRLGVDPVLAGIFEQRQVLLVGHARSS